MADVNMVLNVQLQSGDATARQLDTIGQKGDAAAKTLTSGFSKFETELLRTIQEIGQMQKQLDNAGASMSRLSAPAVSFRREIDATGSSITRMAAPAVTGFKQLADAQDNAGKAAGAHGLQLGRLAAESGTFLGRLLGMNTATSRFAALLGTATTGAVAVIGAIGAVIALTEVYKAWTAEADEAKQKQEDLTKSLLDWYNTQRNGGTFELRKEIEATTQSVLDLQKELDNLKGKSGIVANAQGVAGALGQAPGGVFSSILRIATAGDLSHIVSQFATEIGQGEAKISAAVDTGNQAIDAATKHLEEMLNQNGIAVEKQKALNDAFNAGAYALQLINLAYEHQAALAKNKIDYDDQHIAQANKLTDALYAQQQRAAALTEAQRAMNETWELADKFAAKLTETLHNSQPEWTLNEKQYQTTIDLLKILNDQESTLVKIGERNAAAGAAQVNAAAESIKQAMKYSDDLSKIWRDGIGKITTDGFKSFLDFAQDVEQLFTRLMDRMAERARQLGKEAGGAGYAALGIGAAGLSAGITGYQIGQQSGNYGTGIGGGLASGVATGFAVAGPWGAAIGGIVGAASGLLGASKAQKEAAQAIKDSVNSAKQREGDFINAGQNPILEQRHQLNAQYASLLDELQKERSSGAISQSEYDARHTDLHDALVAQDAKNAADFWQGIGQQLNALDGPLGDYKNQLAALDDQYKENMASAAALHATTAQTAEITDLYTKQVEALNKAFKQANVDSRNSSLIRLYNATGNDDQAFALQQQIEYQKAVDSGLDSLSLAYERAAEQAEADQRERQKQTQILQDQLSTAQQSLEQFKAVYDSLTQFKTSLSIGQYSPLSPRQQLDASRGQLNALYQAALGGDVNAGNQFSSAAQQFLQSSRAYNASGAGYVLDFNSVSVMTDTLQKAFGDRVTDTQKQIDLLQAQIDKLSGVQQAVIDLGDTVTRMNDILVNVQQAAATANIDGLTQVKDAVDDSASDIKTALNGIRATLANLKVAS